MSCIYDASPDPKSHIKTLMRIGYTMPSAVSDILDNSITAKAKNIDILAPLGLEEPSLSIVDDGYGMSLEELISNMRIGCKDPSDDRLKGDLGRFGSGMKTASFSQARKLTVISKKKGEPICGAIWDIDNIEKMNTWCLEVLDRDEVEKHPLLAISDKNAGTQVIWEKLSCLTKNDHSLDDATVMNSNITELKRYISLYFHKFMGGRKGVSFTINKSVLTPTDPFLTGCNGYQEGRGEKLRCHGGYVEIKTHVLPHINKIDKQLLDKIGGANAIAQNQGLYIYREGRLINAGGWLGLVKASQLGALARVEVNIPSALDTEWATDVKKASLQLPPRIKKELKKFLSDPIKRSKRAYTYRGKLDKANKYWDIQENENDKTITYQISSENERLRSILKELPGDDRNKFVQYLGELAANIPLNHIYQKMSEEPKSITQGSVEQDLMSAIMKKYFEVI